MTWEFLSRWMTRAAFALAAVGATLLTGAGPASAEDYPTRPVTIVVPFPPGGATDVLGRLLAHELSAELRQAVVVENRAGAAGATGAAAVAKSTPDGYTLLLGTVSTHAIAIALHSKLGYDAEKDFTPLAYVAGVPNVLVVSPKRVKATTIQAFVTEAKNSQVKLNMASAGTGTSIHLSGEMFKVGVKVDMVHVPYRGSAPAINDLIAGSVDLMFDNLPSCLPQIKAGTLRALAVTSSTRIDSLPGIPTIAETVIPGFEASSWFVLYAPAGTPEGATKRLKAAAAKALVASALKASFAKLGAIPRAMTDQELSRFLADERKKWADVVRASGTKVD